MPPFRLRSLCWVAAIELDPGLLPEPPELSRDQVHERPDPAGSGKRQGRRRSGCIRAHLSKPGHPDGMYGLLCHHVGCRGVQRIQEAKQVGGGGAPQTHVIGAARHRERRTEWLAGIKQRACVNQP